MGLLRLPNAYGYDRLHMPKAPEGPGPWGEAIKHLMGNLIQADLVRLLNEPRVIAAFVALEADQDPEVRKRKKKAKSVADGAAKPKHPKSMRITAKTLGKLMRGYNTQTRVLWRIAAALGRPFHEVLVTPSRVTTHEERLLIWRQVNEEIVRKADAAMHLRSDVVLDDATIEWAKRFQGLEAEDKVATIDAMKGLKDVQRLKQPRSRKPRRKR
jgi:hypothetical protein